MAIATTDVQNDSKAHEALKAGHESSYRFPEGFHGFSGTVKVSKCLPDGTVEHERGTVTVGGPHATEVEGFVSGDIADWTKGELRSMAGHRWPTPYDEADGKHTLTMESEPGNPLGDYIKVHDDRFDSAYRVSDGRISQVIRTMGPMTFTITIQKHQSAPDGHVLPEHFTVNYWKEGRLFRTDMYHDVYRETDGVWTPAFRRVVTAADDGFTTRQLEVTDVSLLTEPLRIKEDAKERTGTRAG